jgi:hypothetical protein
MGPTSAPRRMYLLRVGHIDRSQFSYCASASGWTNEWHLVFANAFEDIEFGLLS